MTDGILLVVQPGKTNQKALEHSLEQLKKGQARTIGIVLNNIAKNNGYYYYGNYQVTDDQVE